MKYTHANIIAGGEAVNKRRMLIIIVMAFLLVSSGCGGKIQKATAPEKTAPEPQINTSITTSTNTDTAVTVPMGPPIREYYDPNQPRQIIQMVYVTTDNGDNYHRVSCKVLSKGKIALGLEEAKEEGYTPCTICKPPQESRYLSQ